MMRKITVSTFTCACLISTAALAVDAKVQSAITVISAAASDPAKLKTYCEMSDVLDAAGDKEDNAAKEAKGKHMKKQGKAMVKSGEAKGDAAEEMEKSGNKVEKAGAKADEDSRKAKDKAAKP